MTVFVHGTRAAQRLIDHKRSPIRHIIHVEPGLSLAKNLPENYHFYKSAMLCSKHDPCGYDIDHFYTYGWNSSDLRPSNRYKNGQELYLAINKQLIEYRKSYDCVNVRIVGNSHGGNVVLNSLAWLPFDQTDACVEVVFFGTPIQEATRDFINNQYVSKAYSFYSTSDWIQMIDPQRLYSACPKQAPFFSRRMFLPTDNVIQVQLKVNGKSIGHGGYRTLLGHLPNIIKQVESSMSSSEDKHVCIDFNDMA